MNAARQRRAMQIFQEALAVEPARRDAFLAATCGDDAELRAAAVSLLQHHRADTLFPQRPDNEAQPPHPARATAVFPRRLRRAAAPALRRFVRVSRTAALMGAILMALASGLGLWTHSRIRQSLRRDVAAELQTILDADVAAVEGWLQRQRAKAQQWADDPRIQQEMQALALQSRAPNAITADLQTTPPFQTLLARLAPEVNKDGVRGVYALNREGMVIFATDAELDGSYYLSPDGARNLTPVFLGRAIMSRPYRAGSQVIGAERLHADEPLMAAAAPVRDNAGRVIGALVFVFESGRDFAALLNIARVGASGETYAFDRQGVMLSESRFTAQVRKLGLLPEASSTALHLRVADPGGDLTAGFRPARSQATWPLTEMAAHAVAGEPGTNVAGYRDYRGVTVYGAWRWLADYDFGIATEIDAQEAAAPLRIVEQMFGLLLGLLLALTAVAVVASLLIVRLREEVEEARQVGQYALEELIGEGGMGKVYRAQHALLKRPTAVKILEQQPHDSAAVARFEREVQLASQLTHPNTIQIYDYGCTPEGVFFYAMEFLPGDTLKQLVAREGALDLARVIHLLRQVCGSLEEAHGLGLVHRDIKPANIMICQRGGVKDVVKVLDFGLAKAIADDGKLQVTGPQELSGTPLYIAPERVRNPAVLDPRSDLYAVGAVAFFLLTGQPVFTGDSPLEVLQQTLHAPARRVSQAADRPVPPELDDLVACCLAKEPSDRPASAGAIRETLDALALAHPWRP